MYLKMSFNQDDRVFNDLMALMDMLTGPAIESIDPENALFDHQDMEKWQTAMSVYINETITDEKRREVIYHLLKAIRSPSRTTGITCVMFFSELLHYTEFMEKSTKMELLRILVEKIHSTDDVEAYFAIKALGNATIGAQREVEKLKNIIIDNLSNRFRSRIQLDLSIQILQAMSKYVRLLKRSKLGSLFDEIVSLCSDYLNHPNIPLQACCIELFADLARSYDKTMCGGFKKHVKKLLSDLLIKLHSKDLQLKASAVAALLDVLPYIRCQNTRQLLSAEGKDISKIYEQLGQEDPALLVNIMIESVRSLCYAEDVDAVVKHLANIKDALPYEALYGTALSDVWKGLKRLTHISGPLPEGATDQLVEILCTKWKCLRTVKKALPRKPPLPEPKTPDAQLKTIIIWETSV